MAARWFLVRRSGWGQGTALIVQTFRSFKSFQKFKRFRKVPGLTEAGQERLQGGGDSLGDAVHAGVVGMNGIGDEQKQRVIDQ